MCTIDMFQEPNRGSDLICYKTTNHQLAVSVSPSPGGWRLLRSALCKAQFRLHPSHWQHGGKEPPGARRLRESRSGSFQLKLHSFGYNRANSALESTPPSLLVSSCPQVSHQDDESQGGSCTPQRLPTCADKLPV